MPSYTSVSVIGAGAWGTALAGVAARAGREVTLYARDPASAAQIAATRKNPRLPDVLLDASVAVTADIARAARADIVLIATPAQHLREAVTALAPHLAKATPVIATAKGIERGTHKFMTEVIAEAAPDARPAILSGPSFAEDVARGLPTAVTLAAKDEALARALVQALGSSTFRPYHTTDVRGVEIGGAAKNVLAIAAGIAMGRKLGASAQAALTTRGFSELVRLGRACGARGETMAGLSGLGDLILTCSSPQSRNLALGIALGRGEAPPREQACRGRVHRAGADRTGGFAKCRYAGIKCGGGDPARRGDDRCGDRRPVDAPVQGGGMKMAYWLVKSEPSAWSWDQQVAKGAKGEAWTGVRNFTARQNLVKMKKGDLAFFYHSNEGKEIVGIAEIIKEAYPDPTDKTGKFVCVDIKADKPLKTPVTMAAIKADKKLADMALVKYSRLSVQPVTAEEWKLVCKMGGL